MEAQGVRGSEGKWEGARGWGGARPLSLTEDPRLSKASEGSQGFLRPQEGPRGSERLRVEGEKEEARGSKREQEGVRGVGEQGEQGEQGPWVWLKTQGCQRLPKACKASWGLRKVPGTQGAQGVKRSEREQEGIRGSKGSKGSKAPESDWRPMADKGFWRLPRLPEAPGRSQGPREAQGEGEQGGARGSKGARG